MDVQKKKFAANITLQNLYNKVAIVKTASEFPEFRPCKGET